MHTLPQSQEKMDGTYGNIKLKNSREYIPGQTKEAKNHYHTFHQIISPE